MIIYFNIVLTWKIVRVSTISVLYINIYIDDNFYSQYGCPRVSPGRVCAQSRTDPPKSSRKKMHPPSTHRSNWVGWFRPPTVGGRVDRSHRSENTALRTRWDNSEKNTDLAKKPRFQWYFPEIQWDFTRSGQILAKISLDFARLGQNLTRSKGKIIGIWVSSPDSGKLSSESRNFGRSLEIFRSVQVFRVLGEENRNRLARIGF